MSELESNVNSAGQHGQDVVNKAADSAKDGIRSAQNVANQTLNTVAGKVDAARDQAAPMVEAASAYVEDLIQYGRDAYRDTTQMIKERAAQATDQTVAYTKDEPIKALLIAAATGALLMGLLTVIASSRD